MANLLGQNIGTNYKGILNLNTLNGNLSGTLQAVTDGDGNASLLQLSTTLVSVFSGASRVVSFDTNGEWLGYGSSKIVPYNFSTGQFLLQADTSFQMLFQIGSTEAMRINNNKDLAIGTTSASARLHVTGDGTNTIARFEDNTNSPMLRIENSLMRFGASTPFGCLQFAMLGTTFSGNNNGTGLGFYSQNSLAGTSDRFDFGFSGDAVANTAGAVSHLALVRNFAAGAGSANFRPLSLAYTINNSGAQTGTATGIFLNATETALNGMTHNLMDLQTGGVSQFRISKTDATIYATNYNISASVYLGSAIAVSNSGGVKVGDSRIRSDADGNLTLLNDAANSFGLLKLGGTTNAFPALKRSGAGIQIRLADDSDFALFDSAAININHTSDGVLSFTKAGTNTFSFQKDSARIYFYNNTLAQPAYSITNNNAIVFGNSFDAVLSAQLEIVSTTKGFLPPRMTTTQKNAISTPASGLVVYDSTLNKLAVYTGSAWETVTSI